MENLLVSTGGLCDSALTVTEMNDVNCGDTWNLVSTDTLQFEGDPTITDATAPCYL